MLQNITFNDLEFVTTKEANLGKGSYGEVQLAIHKDSGIQIAVKKIDKASLSSNKIKETLIREIRIQKQLNHEYICRLYTSFEDKTTIYLALEYASKGNLFYLIRKEKFLSEDTAFYFFIQVCSGIYYMHKQGLIHRDIKPENILIKEGNIIKICDFGWCVQTDNMQQRNTFCGTLEYMAPEMIQNKAHNHTLDIWSLGILLYELVHGRAPFTGVHPREISDKIMRGQIRFKPGLSNEYKDLVNKILVYETTERLPLIKVFDHPWVKNFEKKYNLSKQPTKSTKKKQKEKQAPPPNQKMNLSQNEKQQPGNKEPESVIKGQEPIENGNQHKKIILQNDIQSKKKPTDMVLTGLVTPDQRSKNKPNDKSLEAIRMSRKSNTNDDIIKELEDYVKEKKGTDKFLDGISDIDSLNPTPQKGKENTFQAKLQKNMSQETYQPPSTNNTSNNQGTIQNTENPSNIDVYDYCDKMMKEMSSLDRKLENSMTGNHRDLSIRLSSNRQNADEILNIYDQLENETGDG